MKLKKVRRLDLEAQVLAERARAEKAEAELADCNARVREYARALMETHIADCSLSRHAPHCLAYEILPMDREQALADVDAWRKAQTRAALRAEEAR